MDWKNAVNLAMDGKEEGYNYLYQQTYQKSYYVALKYVKQEDAALDVLQNAYIKAFKNLEQLQDADKFPAWFGKVVVTKALDELKKSKALLFSQIEGTDENFNIADSFQDDRIDTQPELSMDKKETSRLVKEMIDTLSDEQRLCIMMFYVEEMTVKDIAETLGVSENTVKSRLNYGRKNIKEKVVELERKGTKLYSLAPVSFFLYLLLSDSQNAQACELPVNSILETASKEAVEAIKVQQTAGALSQVVGKVMGLLTKKAIIGIAAAIAAGGCAVAGVLAYQAHQDKLAQEVIAAQEQADRLTELLRQEEVISASTIDATENKTTEQTTADDSEGQSDTIQYETGQEVTSEDLTTQTTSTNTIPQQTTTEAVTYKDCPYELFKVVYESDCFVWYTNGEYNGWLDAQNQCVEFMKENNIFNCPYMSEWRCDYIEAGNYNIKFYYENDSIKGGENYMTVTKLVYHIPTEEEKQAAFEACLPGMTHNWSYSPTTYVYSCSNCHETHYYSWNYLHIDDDDDSKCDICGIYCKVHVCVPDVENSDYATCTICGNHTPHFDKDNDGYCDYCYTFIK